VVSAGVPAVATATEALPPRTGETAANIVIPTPSDPIPVPVPTLRRALVITVGFTGSGTTPAGSPDRTTSDIADVFAQGVNPWFEEVSHGRFPGFATAGVGAVRVQPLATLCSQNWLSDVAARADTASRAQGVDPNSFRTVVYYFARLPQTRACDWEGRAEVGGRRVWLNGVANLQTLAHELGHHLGLGHAGAQFCVDRDGRRVPLSGPVGTTCTQTEYGDAYTAMGEDQGYPKSFSSAELAKLGWNTGRVRTISAGEPTVTTVLRRLEDHAPFTTQALRLVDGVTTLWVEYRVNPFNPTQPALLVRAEQPSLAPVRNPAPFLLDMSPDDGDHTRPLGTRTRQEMRVGQAWTNPLGQMTIWLTSADPLNATVTIQSTPEQAPAPLPTGRVVPNVIGDTPATATNRIAAVGLVRGTASATIDCESLGKVVSQSPVPGTQLPTGGVVDIKYGVTRPGGCGTPQ
jgi:hypothetical protein